jgi:hypothetical protein
MCTDTADKLKENLYKVIPTSALLSEGANSLDLDSNARQTIKSLANVEEALLRRALQDANSFAHKPLTGIDVPPKDREHLLALLGRYGVYTAVSNHGNCSSVEELATKLHEAGGVPRVYDLIVRPLGNHAYLIRLEYIIGSIEATLGTIDNDNRAVENVTLVCELIKDKLKQWQSQESLLFNELKVLKSYYDGKIKIHDPQLEDEFL